MRVNLERSIVKVLSYFDIFQYPLTEKEILFFLDTKCQAGELSPALRHLIERNIVFRQGIFYALDPDERLYHRRLQGNARAERMLVKARRIAAFLYRFPFVRGVGISGSLSKNFADEQSDIDYFIIAKAGRLWIARTLMHCYKKMTFLTGRQHWYCMNYYISDEEPAIAEQNIYTAIETITLLPACGEEGCDLFYKANAWAENYFPNAALPTTESKDKPVLLKTAMEKIFSASLFERLDNYLCKLTARRWKQKELDGRLNLNGICLSLLAEKHCARPDPKYYQPMVLEKYRERLAKAEQKLQRPLIKNQVQEPVR